MTLFLAKPYLAPLEEPSVSPCQASSTTPHRRAKVSQAIEQEIRTLRTHFWSARDPEGRAFAPLADAYRRKGDLDEAIALVEDGLARLPEFSPGHLVAGRIFRARGDLEAARESLDHVLELDSENVLALLERSELARDTGDREGAMEGLRRLLDLDPDHLGARAALDRLEAAAPAPEAGAVDVPPEPEAADESEEDESEKKGALLDFEATSLDDLDQGTWGLMDEEGLGEEDLEGFETTGLTEELDEAEPRDAGDDLAVFDFGMDVTGDVEPGPTVDRPPLDSQGVDPVLEVEGVDDLADPPALSAGVEDLPPHLVTRTMAELYLTQGLTEDGIRIYEKLAEKHPDDDAVRNRLEELHRETETAAQAPEPAPPLAEPEPEPDTETGPAAEFTPASETAPIPEEPSADDLDDMAPQWSGEEADEDEDPATPFAWASGAEAEDEEAVEADAGRSIRQHFDDLLAWVPGAVPIGDLSPEAREERAPAGSPLAQRLTRPRGDVPAGSDAAGVPAAPPESETPTVDAEPGAAPPDDEGDDDLDDFRSWLESLGS